jgi:hypothetical protein
MGAQIYPPVIIPGIYIYTLTRFGGGRDEKEPGLGVEPLSSTVFF